jgi:hypothetical protein
MQSKINAMINWLKKMLPAYIEIRSLYWVQVGSKMESSLKCIFDSIDKDDYQQAKVLIKEFESVFTQNEAPNWIAGKYSEIQRAKSMITFLESPE